MVGGPFWTGSGKSPARSCGNGSPAEFAASNRRRAEIVRQVRQIEAEVERLAARIGGIVRTHEHLQLLASYQPPIRQDGTRYDAAAHGGRLAEMVRRRLGIEQ